MARGRTPDAEAPRDSWVHVRYTPTETEALDLARGSISRSAFVREAVSDRIRRSAR